jgi:hypothetical protein
VTNIFTMITCCTKIAGATGVVMEFHNILAVKPDPDDRQSGMRLRFTANYYKSIMALYVSGGDEVAAALLG